MRDRDTHGETVEECQENLDGIREADHHLTLAARALQVAIGGYLATVADESHQWFDPTGQPIHQFALQAWEQVVYAQQQLARFEAIWRNRLEIAQMGEDDD